MKLFASILGTPELMILALFIAVIFSIVHALYDIKNSEFSYGACRLIFILLVIFVPILGGFIYFMLKPAFEVNKSAKVKQVQE